VHLYEWRAVHKRHIECGEWEVHPNRKEGRSTGENTRRTQLDLEPSRAYIPRHSRFM